MLVDFSSNEGSCIFCRPSNCENGGIFKDIILKIPVFLKYRENIFTECFFQSVQSTLILVDFGAIQRASLNRPGIFWWSFLEILLTTLYVYDWFNYIRESAPHHRQFQILWTEGAEGGFEGLHRENFRNFEASKMQFGSIQSWIINKKYKHVFCPLSLPAIYLPSSVFIFSRQMGKYVFLAFKCV